MKFINYLENITGIEIYPLISFVLFFVFFVFVSYYALKTDKAHLNELSNIPLDNTTK